MSLYRRGKDGIWWVRFTAPGGRRIRQSSGTVDRTKAQEYHDQLKAERWRTSKLGEKPRRVWEDAVVRWLRESHKATLDKDKAHFRWLDRSLRGRYLDEVTRDVVDGLTDARLNQGVSNASVNRVLALLRAVLRKAAYDWEWIDRVPRVRMLPEAKRRVRWITREEADRLLLELPEHLADMARFTLATGLRQANVKRLEWTQVDLERRVAWIHPDQAKARKAIPVPLNADAVLVLRRRQGKHPLYVFTYQGHPVEQVNTKAWREALQRAGIADFRWHDLRHTFASWHVQAGTPLNVLQELGGWESAEMVRRYAHFSADHLREHAERLARPHIVSVPSAGHKSGTTGGEAGTAEELTA